MKKSQCKRGNSDTRSGELPLTLLLVFYSRGHFFFFKFFYQHSFPMQNQCPGEICLLQFQVHSCFCSIYSCQKKWFSRWSKSNLLQMSWVTLSAFAKQLQCCASKERPFWFDILKMITNQLLYNTLKKLENKWKYLPCLLEFQVNQIHPLDPRRLALYD